MYFLLLYFLLLPVSSLPVSTTAEDRRDNPEERNTDPSLIQGDIIPSKGRSAVFLNSDLWPCGRVPYEVSGSYSAAQQSLIRSAAADFQDTGFTFSERTVEMDYVRIEPGNGGCSSNIGRQGGQQSVYLYHDCFSAAEPGTIHHELMHVVGFYHEQSRRDRGTYVNIHNENIMSGSSHNFDVIQQSRVSGTEYDYDSVMHYSAYAFSSNGQPTITPRDGSPPERLGQRQGLSPTDREELRRINMQGSASCLSSGTTSLLGITDTTSTFTEATSSSSTTVL